MEYDIIFVAGEPFVDHPFSAVGILKKVLEDNGYSVGIIETPDWKKDDDFVKLGKPKLFFAVTSGSMDSMIVNFTPMKKRRQDNNFSKMTYRIPDRAIIAYCNIVRKLFKDSKMVLGGVEASLRRFAHYDYMDNDLRKSILLDSRADILVFGYGEKQVVEIANKIKDSKDIKGIDGTCIVSKEAPANFAALPSFDEVAKSKEAFCKMQNMLDPDKNIAQKFDNRYVLQHKAMDYTTKDLDYIYGLNYSRKIPEKYKEFKVVEFSVLTHRGCFGDCNFCSISANTGKKVVSRSIGSIIDEIKKITNMPKFRGTIELSGASANMYGMDCINSKICKKDCNICKTLDTSHKRLVQLLRGARKIPKVKRVFIKSGIRYDLAAHSPEYVREIIKHHIDKRLMIAPEHTNKEVLKLMNKDIGVEEFKKLFYKICHEERKKLELSYYMMVCHPGCTIENSKELGRFIRKNKNADFVQVFTPTPMTVSTCMYYTSINPKTMKRIYVPYTYNEKKRQKNIALGEDKL